MFSKDYQVTILIFSILLLFIVAYFAGVLGALIGLSGVDNNIIIIRKKL